DGRGDDLGGAMDSDRQHSAGACDNPAVRDVGGDPHNLARSHDARLLGAEEEGRRSLLHDSDLFPRVRVRLLLIAGSGVEQHDADLGAVLAAGEDAPTVRLWQRLAGTDTEVVPS